MFKVGRDPLEEIEGFRVPPWWEDDTVGWINAEEGDGADNAAGGTWDILGVEDAKPDSVATEEEELDRVGLEARADGVGNEGFDRVDGDGRECAEEIVVGAGPG